MVQCEIKFDYNRNEHEENFYFVHTATLCAV